MAARPSSACSMSLPDRIAIGRSDRQLALKQRRARWRAPARASARRSACASAPLRRAARGRSRSGAAFAQCSSRSVSFCGISRQRMRRAHQDRAVAAALDHHVRRPEPHRPQRRASPMSRAFSWQCASSLHCVRPSGRAFPEKPSAAPWPRRRLARSPPSAPRCKAGGRIAARRCAAARA